MKLTSLICLFVLGMATANAQIPVSPLPATPETFITGTLAIDFATRSHRGKAAVVDTYQFDVNVSNSSAFYGTITQLPYISGTLGSYGAQNGNLTYDLKCDVLNPKNPSQRVNVGAITGIVPVNAQNVYQFDAGNLVTRVFARGTAKGFDSQAKGYALGKPPSPSPSILDKMRKEAMTFTKQVGNQTQRIVVTKYDIMEFRNHVLSAGPVQIYGEVTVNGQMVYGYDRNSWYFSHLTLTYWVTEANGQSHQVADSISGDVRWVEDPKRAVNGVGEYQFDIRVNELPPSENAIFVPPADESAFFTNDVAAMGLSGTMKYIDKMSDGTPLSSSVKIDLHGNKITKATCMALAKVLLFSAVIPLNSE